MTPLAHDLARLLGPEALRTGPEYLHDMTEMQRLGGTADAVVAPANVEQIQALVAWCYRHGVAMVPRGGGTGFAGGAVPAGGVVCSLERLGAVRRFEPERWRVQVDAGVTTGAVHRLARESGLFYGPDPGAAEQSQIGGNVACNAGGPHSFKYGVTREWVMSLEVVVSGGRLMTLGGALRKDVAGYDLTSLMVGSEGTLGIITGAWLRLLPAPEVAWPMVAAYPDRSAGAAAVRQLYGSGLVPAILEYVDEGAVDASRASFPAGLPDDARFLVIVEADGCRSAAEELSDGLRAALEPGALLLQTYPEAASARQLWRWRNGLSFAVMAQRGGKMSEDVAVPVECLEEALELTSRIGAEVGLPTCSWGHAGDGNLHATFMIDPSDPADLVRARRGIEALFAGVLGLGGTITGEHGVGLVKRDFLYGQLGEPQMELQRSIKRLFDPANLFNPGKKIVAGPEARPDPGTPSSTR